MGTLHSKPGLSDSSLAPPALGTVHAAVPAAWRAARAHSGLCQPLLGGSQCRWWRWALVAAASRQLATGRRPIVCAGRARLPQAVAALHVAPGEFLGGLGDREDCMPPPGALHFVKGTPLHPPWPEGMQEAMFGMGCFWSAESLFMRLEGVHSTQVGFAGGTTANPRYDDICGGATGHAEVVRVVFDPRALPYRELLRIFWESHDPTSWNRQGADRGTEYRSALFFYSEEQCRLALETRDLYQAALKAAGIRRSIRTEILPAPTFYYSEEFHQQCDAKPGSDADPHGSLSPTGVLLPVEGA